MKMNTSSRVETFGVHYLTWYMPQLTTAFSLLLGLGARIVYNKFFSFRVPGIEVHVLSGLWQGVALYYVLMEFPFLTLPVGFGIGARLLVNFVITYDAAGCACTLLGVAVGVLFTDILSQLLEDGDAEEAYYEGSVVSDYPRRRRLVQLRGSSYDDPRAHDHNRRRRAFLDADPSVTTAATNTTGTWDSLSDWIDPNHTMTPLEREVAALRKKASMADSERRRFKEEKQWAQVQGNKARAAQMGWQVKRYSALMQSFHREADLRLLEGSFCLSIFFFFFFFCWSHDLPYTLAFFFFFCSEQGATTSGARIDAGVRIASSRPILVIRTDAPALAARCHHRRWTEPSKAAEPATTSDPSSRRRGTGTRSTPAVCHVCRCTGKAT